MKNALLLLSLLAAGCLGAQSTGWLNSTSSEMINKSHNFWDSDYREGYYYMAGEYWRDMIIDGTAVSLDATDENQNSFVARVDPTGGVDAFYEVRGDGYQRITKVQATDDGSVWIGGFFRQTMSYQDTSITAVSFNDSFLMRVDSEGNLMELFHIPGAEMWSGVSLTDLIWSEADQKLWMMLNFSGSLIFDGVTYEANQNTDALLVEMSASGEVLRTHYFRTDDEVEENPFFSLSRMALDSYGNLYVGGQTGGPVFLDEIQLNHEVMVGWAFVAKFAPSGELEWFNYFQSASSNVNAMVLDDKDHLYLGFQFFSYITIDGISESGSGSFGETAVVKVLPDGSVSWSELFIRDSFCGTCGVYPIRITVDEDEVLLGGFFDGNMLNNEQAVISAPQQWGYLLHLSAENGQLEQSWMMENPGSYSRLRILQAGGDGYLLGGEFYGQLQFNGNTTSATAAALFYSLLARDEVVSTTDLQTIEVTANTWPNPTKGKVYVQWPALDFAEHAWQLFSPEGKLLMKGIWRGDSASVFELDLGGLPSGRYYIKLGNQTAIATK